MIRTLVQHEVDIDAKYCDGRTPIHLAASGGSARLKSLLQCEPNVHVKDHDRNAALHFAVPFKDNTPIKTLVHAKTSTEPQSKQGLTALLLAFLRRVYRHCGTVDE